MRLPIAASKSRVGSLQCRFRDQHVITRTVQTAVNPPSFHVPWSPITLCARFTKPRWFGLFVAGRKLPRQCPALSDRDSTP